METVAHQVATKAVVVESSLQDGRQVLVLQLSAVERYAGSLIVAARNNPRRVPALEETQLGSSELSFPGIAKKNRLQRDAERVVLEFVTELLVARGVCFRHEGLLIFPALLRAAETAVTGAGPGGLTTHFDFSGAIDNVYASLIAWLVIGESFGRLRLWENRAETITAFAATAP